MLDEFSDMDFKIDATYAKDWLEEINDFTSNLSRQAQATLGRIKIDFLRSGKKFDTDFRDHFLFIANNRYVFNCSTIVPLHNHFTVISPFHNKSCMKFNLFFLFCSRLLETFDAFLIGLPKELKANDCTINRCNTPKAINRPNVEANPADQMSQLVCGVAEWHRPYNYVDTVSKPATSQIAKSHANNSMNALENVTKNVTKKIPAINVNRITSKKTAISSSLSSHAMTKLSKHTATKSVVASTKKVKKTFQGMPHSKAISKTKHRTNTLESARDLTNFHMYLAENKLSSQKNPERRMTLGGPMVMIPKQTIESNALSKSMIETNCVAQSKAQLKNDVCTEKVTPKRVYKRRNTMAGRELSSRIESNAIQLVSSKQWNVPLPVGRVSRGKHQCNLCAYSTEVKTNYNRHSLIHTGEKPFKCQHCDKGFTQKVNLMAHVRKYHCELSSEPFF